MALCFLSSDHVRWRYVKVSKNKSAEHWAFTLSTGQPWVMLQLITLTFKISYTCLRCQASTRWAASVTMARDFAQNPPIISHVIKNRQITTEHHRMRVAEKKIEVLNNSRFKASAIRSKPKLFTFSRFRLVILAGLIMTMVILSSNLRGVVCNSTEGNCMRKINAKNSYDGRTHFLLNRAVVSDILINKNDAHSRGSTTQTTLLSYLRTADTPSYRSSPDLS